MIRLILIACLVFTTGCTGSNKKVTHDPLDREHIKGDLIIFHAGSLSVPFREMASAFKSIYPDVNILMESAGSVASARKITDLDKPCDIMASADYRVIEEMLIPEHTDWCIPFASNEMAIVYGENSRFSQEITSDNWYNILLNDEVAYGRSDPNSDPCGYRAVLTIQLAERYYQQEGITAQFLSKDNRYIRPKEVDLLALLETGTIDYLFLYRSVAEQHHLPYLLLPDEINLANPDLTSLYSQVSVEINGKEPGEKIVKYGEPMIYGVTILEKAPNRKAAELFTTFLLDPENGQKIVKENGQPSVVPSCTRTYARIPEEFKKFAKRYN